MASIMAQSQLPSMLPNSADVTEKKSAKWQDLGSTEKQSLFLSVTYNNIVNDISVAVIQGTKRPHERLLVRRQLYSPLSDVM